LYHVFSLGLRDVELILAERGIAISFETIRRWVREVRPDILVRSDVMRQPPSASSNEF
jgi:putative transposase